MLLVIDPRGRDGSRGALGVLFDDSLQFVRLETKDFEDRWRDLLDRHEFAQKPWERCILMSTKSALSGVRRAGVTGFGVPEHHGDGSALPMPVQSGNLSLEIWSSGGCRSIQEGINMTTFHGWYDVTDIAYGADRTGMTNSLPAILKAMAAMPLTRPGTLYFPPGNYLCEDDIHLTRMCVMQGAGAAIGDVPATTITFAAGKGVIVEAQTTSPILNGFGGHSIIRQIEFIGATLPLKDRENNKDYILGDKIRTPAHNDNRYYFEWKVNQPTLNPTPTLHLHICPIRARYAPRTGLPSSSDRSSMI